VAVGVGFFLGLSFPESEVQPMTTAASAGYITSQLLTSNGRTHALPPNPTPQGHQLVLVLNPRPRPSMGRLHSAPTALAALLAAVGLGGGGGPRLISGQSVMPQPEPQPQQPRTTGLARCDTSHEARDQIAKEAVRSLWASGDFEVIEVRRGVDARFESQSPGGMDG